MKNEKIKNYLLENEEEFVNVVSELNSWNGCLEWLEYMENDEEFFKTYFNNNPMEVARAVSYGDYNYTDEYVRFDAYGNLESCAEYNLVSEYENYIDDIVDNLIENYRNIDVHYELEDLLEEEEA